MNEYNNDLFLLGNNQGDENLRIAISGYLHGQRGVNCQAEQIIVGAGVDYLLQLLAKLLSLLKSLTSDITLSQEISLECQALQLCLSPEMNIAMENPTYMRAYHIFSGSNYKITPIALDQYGMNIEQLTKSNADLAYVTPSHQYPLGIIMPIKRRMELLKWAANSSNRYIIEDDHDSEFRYKGKPIPSLQSIDSLDKVIYIGTFSRAIAPAIRVGYMVLPKSLMTLYQNHLHYYASTVSRVDQYIITHFITDGYFERHLNRIRTLYKNKHDLLIQCLKVFKNKITIEGENAGLHLVVRFLTKHTEEEILALTDFKGIKLYGLSRHYISKDPNQTNPTILLGYANLTEDEIQKGVATLYDTLKDYL